MLYLTRREGEAVIVNNEIEVRVLGVRGRTVRLGFRFPPDTTVLREELFEQIRRANEEAATAGRSLAGTVARKGPKEDR
ncbi:carbon storage regulator [Geminicoccaceae bacterium 1502E]|nr:carbon storage regulator [Geminicoccaceae bacterium 1502E]